MMMTPSSEDPVQVPGRRAIAALLIETVAEHPVTVTLIVLDAVIVARLSLLLPKRAPPFRRDTLRSLRLDHAAGDAAPGEARRRAFLHLRQHGNRLRLGEQKDRAMRFGGAQP